MESARKINLRAACRVCGQKSPDVVTKIKAMGWRTIRPVGERWHRWYCPTCPAPEAAPPGTPRPPRPPSASMRMWPHKRRTSVHCLPMENGRVLWAFGIKTLAAAANVQEGTIRGAIATGAFDPMNLVSLARWLLSRTAHHGSRPETTRYWDMIHMGRGPRPPTIETIVSGFHELGFMTPAEGPGGTHVVFGFDRLTPLSAQRVLEYMKANGLRTLERFKIRALAALGRVEKRGPAARPKVRQRRTLRVADRLRELGVADVRERDARTMWIAGWVIDVERAADLADWLKPGGAKRDELLSALAVVAGAKRTLDKIQKRKSEKRKDIQRRRLHKIATANRKVEQERAEATIAEGAEPAGPAAP